MTSNSPNPARPGHAGRAKLAEMRVRRSEKKPELITGMVDGHDTGTGQFSGLAHGLDMRAVGAKFPRPRRAGRGQILLIGEKGAETTRRYGRPARRAAMPNKTKNPGALAGATGVDREKHYSPEHAKIGPHGQGRYTGFKSLKWERNVLDVIAAARTLKLTDSPTFLAAAVAMDMACFAGQDGRLFRAADDGADAVGASVSNVRDARDWLCRAGLAEKIKVTNDQITGADRKRTRKKKGRDAQDFQLLFVDVQEAIFRLNAGGNTSTYSTPMEAEYSMPISTPKKAPYSAPMGVTTGEEPKRARARANARPAPITTDRAYSSIIEGDQLKGTDKYTERGLPALEAPAPASHERASAPVCDPDAWRSDPELSCVPTAMEHIPLARRREPCASERPHVVTDFSDFMPDDEDFDTLPPSHVGRAPEGAPGPNLHIDGDVDLFLNDDNHEFLRHLKRAECELATLHGAAEIEIQRHLNDALDGLSGGDSTAADRFRRDLWHLLREVHHSRRDTVFREHLDIVRSFLAQAIGGMRYADDAIKVFIQDIWGECQMADEITALPGMRRRFLRMDAASIALQLVPLLDRGDREAATTFWFEWRERADRALERKGIGPAVRLALIRSASDEIRREIIAIRGVAALGPVDPAKRPIPARPTAQVVPFRQRVGGAA